jgi:hypothetical protein
MSLAEYICIGDPRDSASMHSGNVHVKGEISDVKVITVIRSFEG